MFSQSTCKISISMNVGYKVIHLSVDFSKELASMILVSQLNTLFLYLQSFFTIITNVQLWIVHFPFTLPCLDQNCISDQQTEVSSRQKFYSQVIFALLYIFNINEIEWLTDLFNKIGIGNQDEEQILFTRKFVITL